MIGDSVFCDCPRLCHYWIKVSATISNSKNKYTRKSLHFLIFEVSRGLTVADDPAKSLCFHMPGMIANNRRNLGNFGKIEPLPIFLIYSRPSQMDICSFLFSYKVGKS